MTKKKQSTEAAVRDIRRRTRRKFSPEEKIRIVLEASGVSRASPSFAAERASRPTSTTAGARTSSKPARSGLLGTQSERRRAMR